MSVTAAEVTAHLRGGRYRQGDEFLLHEDLASRLGGTVAFEREVVLGPGERIDFLCAGGIGIECKARATRKAIYRQLGRYARHDRIQSLILVTATALGLPAMIEGKPVFYVSLGRASL